MSRNDALPGTKGRRRVHLMRHGAVRYFDEAGVRVADPDLVALTSRGRQEAAAMGALLADVAFDRAICSGLARTRQTAEGVLGTRPLALEERSDLREIRSGGTAAFAHADLERDYAAALEHAHEPGARFVGGEAFAPFRERVLAAWETLLAEPGWSQMLLVCHGMVNRVILGWMIGGDLRQLGLFEQDTGCLNVLDIDRVDGGAPRRLIRLLNFTPENSVKQGQYLTTLEHGLALMRRRQETAAAGGG